MSHFKFIDLFSGIGGFHAAAASLGGRCVFASEIDAEARKAYQENYHFAPAGDITQIPSDAIPDHHILFAGFPCQPFSIIGNKQGFADTRGSLFFEIARILEKKKPECFVLENVKQLATHDSGRTMRVIQESLKELGYKVYWRILNAIDYGLPQKRERIIIVGFADHSVEFHFPLTVPMKPLNSVLEPDHQVDKKHFVSDAIKQKRMLAHASDHRVAIWHENKSGNISSPPYSCALRAGASYNYLLVNGIRRLTPREMIRLHGFSDDFKIVCNDAQTRKQAGNAVPVPMVKAVLEQVLYALSKTKRQEDKAA